MQPPGFVSAVVVPETPAAGARSSADRMEIVLAKGRRIIVDAGVDATALALVVEVLER
jgi:transposase